MTLSLCVLSLCSVPDNNKSHSYKLAFTTRCELFTYFEIFLTNNLHNFHNYHNKTNKTQFRFCFQFNQLHYFSRELFKLSTTTVFNIYKKTERNNILQNSSFCDGLLSSSFSSYCNCFLFHTTSENHILWSDTQTYTQHTTLLVTTKDCQNFVRMHTVSHWWIFFSYFWVSTYRCVFNSNSSRSVATCCTLQYC